MFKKEIVWREILFQAIEKHRYNFQQKELAEKFGFSLSTVFNALKKPREIKAIKVGGRGFDLVNPEKLLYLWATERRLEKDIIYYTFVSETRAKIEQKMPDKIIWGLFSAYRYKFKSSPSDYDKVYIYANQSQLLEIKRRFPQKKGPANLFVLRADRFFKNYGRTGTLAQIFVDIWNTNYWYAQEFLRRLKGKMNI
jgi:hypothetical protein